MAWRWMNLCSARSSGSADRVPFARGRPVAQPTNRYLHTSPHASLRCTVSHGFPPNISLCSYVLPSRRQERASSLWLRGYRLLSTEHYKRYFDVIFNLKSYFDFISFWFHSSHPDSVSRSFESARRTSKHRTAIYRRFWSTLNMDQQGLRLEMNITTCFYIQARLQIGRLNEVIWKHKLQIPSELIKAANYACLIMKYYLQLHISNTLWRHPALL